MASRFIFAIATLIAFSGNASAGVFSDDLSKCMVAKSSSADQSIFVRWIFSAMAQHPDVKPLSNITDAQRNDLNRKAGEFLIRLVTEDCRPQMVAALKYEGANAIPTAFQTLGEAAMQELMSNPAVDQDMDSMKTYIDTTKIQDVLKEAGRPVRQDPTNR